MAEPKLATAFWVKIDLIRISDGATNTIRFGDFSHIADELYPGQLEILPGLIDINGFALEVGEPLPVKNGGTFTIDCTRGVFNRDGRASDYIKDNFWINSRVTINSWKGYPTTFSSTSGDVRIEFVGTVKDLQYNPQTNQLKVTVEPLPISTRFEQEKIDLQLFPNATENFGKYLPICFGQPIVPAYVIYSDTYTGAYAYASYPDTFTNANYEEVYTPNFLREYVPITDEGLANPKFGNTSGTTTGRTLRAPYNDGATPPASRSFRQRFTATKNYLGQRISIALKNVTGAPVTYNMIFTCRIFRKIKTEQGDVEFQLLATGSEEFDGITVANNGNSTATILFDTPVPFEIGKRYFLEFAIAGNENQTVDYLIDLIRLNQTGSNLYRRLGTAADFDRVAKDQAFNWEITGYLIDNLHTANTSKIDIAPNAIPSGTEESTWDRLEIVIKAGGLQDDSSGTITGTANSLINDPYEITRFMLRDQLSFLDTTTFDAANIIRTKYPRSVTGYTKGRQSNEQILAEILKETACKLVPRNDGLSTKAWALYPYGYQSNTIRYLSEQEVKIVNFRMFGKESVVNKIDLAYGESAIPQSTSNLQAGQPQRFTKFKSLDNDSGGNWTTWTAESFARFGDRPNNNGWTQLEYIADDKSAEFFAQYLLQAYARPKVIVELELPFFDNDNRSIQCMDIIELSHPDMPAEFGTLPDSLTPMPVYNGAVVETANFGFGLRMAQSYKLQVIGRQVIFNIAGNGAAALRLDCRLLWNPYEIY